MAQTKQSPDPFELLARSQNSCVECSEPSNDDDDDDDDDRESENTSFLHAAAVVAMRENNVFRRQCSLFFFFFFFFFGFQLEKDEQHESEEGLETESKRGAWDEQRARSRARTGGGGRRTKTFVFLLFFFFFCVQGTSSFEREKQQDVFRAAQSDDFQSLGAVLLSFEWRLRVDEHGEYDSEAQVDYSGASGAEV